MEKWTKNSDYLVRGWCSSFQIVQQAIFPMSCNYSKSDENPSAETFVGECQRWSKGSLSSFRAGCWNPVNLDLGEFAQWACSRAAHPARLKTTGLGIRNTSPWVRYLSGCPCSGIQFVWWQSRNILLRPPYYGDCVSSELCVLLGRCAGLFPKSHSTHTQNLGGIECLCWSDHWAERAQPKPPSRWGDLRRHHGFSTMSMFVEGIIFYWIQGPFQPLCCLYSLYPWNWTATIMIFVIFW